MSASRPSFSSPTLFLLDLWLLRYLSQGPKLFPVTKVLPSLYLPL